MRPESWPMQSSMPLTSMSTNWLVRTTSNAAAGCSSRVCRDQRAGGYRTGQSAGSDSGALNGVEAGDVNAPNECAWEGLELPICTESRRVCLNAGGFVLAVKTHGDQIGSAAVTTEQSEDVEDRAPGKIPAWGVLRYVPPATFSLPKRLPVMAGTGPPFTLPSRSVTP